MKSRDFNDHNQNSNYANNLLKISNTVSLINDIYAPIFMYTSTESFLTPYESESHITVPIESNLRWDSLAWQKITTNGLTKPNLYDFPHQ